MNPFTASYYGGFSTPADGISAPGGAYHTQHEIAPYQGQQHLATNQYEEMEHSYGIGTAAAASYDKATKLAHGDSFTAKIPLVWDGTRSYWVYEKDVWEWCALTTVEADSEVQH